jgi:cytochrome c553
MKNTKAFSLAVLSLLGASAGIAATAPENWDEHCSKCHGVDGTGGTAIGKKLKVRNYTDPKSIEGFSDEQLFKAIAEGVVKNGKEAMKGYQSDLSAEDIKALVDLVRKLQRK